MLSRRLRPPSRTVPQGPDVRYTSRDTIGKNFTRIRCQGPYRVQTQSSSAAANMHVAVAIVGYRNADDVCACVTALARSTHDDFEVVICENGGGDAFEA